MSNFQSWNDISDYIKSVMVPGKLGNTTVEKLRSAFLAITSNMAVGGIDPAVDATWKVGVTYARDTQPVLWRDMWLVSNVTSNLGIEPVTAQGVINPTWRIVGSSVGSGIRPWGAIVYPNVMEIVFSADSLYYLDRDVVGIDPFLSADFSTERSEGKWVNFSNAGYQMVGTYAEFSTLSATDTLIPGLEYLITDYYTRHGLVNDSEVIHNGDEEPIIIRAISSNSFSTKARSLYYTTHELEYDFTNIRVETVAYNTRPGLIKGRIDPTLKKRCDFDFLGCASRHFKITGKVYQAITKSDDSTLAVTIAGNIPSLSNQRRYEVSFATMTHTEGQKTIEITYNNGVVTKPLKYYLEQSSDGEIPVDYLSEKKGTMIYNPELDAYVLMSFIDIGSDLIGTYSASQKTNFTIQGITFIVDGADFQDLNVFQGDSYNVHLSGEPGKNLPSSVFMGEAKNIHIPDHTKKSVWTKNINGFRVGAYVESSIIDSPEWNHNTENHIYGTILLNSGFTAYHVDHSFQTLSRCIITPSANMTLGALDLVTIILQAGGGMTAMSTIQQTNMFLTGLNIGSVPNNFIITAPIFQTLLGYFDANNLKIDKTLNGKTIYTRDAEVDNVLGRTLVDVLKFKNMPATTTAPTTPIAIDENGKVVKGDSIFSEKNFDTIALRDAYEVTNLPFQAFVENDGDGKWASYKATSIGVPATYMKIMDQDLFGAIMTAAQIATAYEGYLDVARFTTALLTKLTGIEPLAEVNFTPAEIVAELVSITDEADKLPRTAFQATLFSDQFEINEVTGAIDVATNDKPINNSLDFLTSGTIYNYIKKLYAGFAPVFSRTGDTKEFKMRRIIGKNGVFYACSSDGTSSRFYTSVDGKFFVPGGDTGVLPFYAMDISYSGTIIIAGRDAGTDTIRRSIDGGISFSIITITPSVKITGLVFVGAGRWVACGWGGKVIFSTDDGLTWTESTVVAPVSGVYAFQGIAYGDGMVFTVANDGENRAQISLDFGATFQDFALGANRSFAGTGYFKGNIVLRRTGSGSTGGYVTVSPDRGISWAEKLFPTNTALSISGMSVIMDYLYLYGSNGYMIKTDDLETYEEVISGTTNTISAMAVTYQNGRPVIMFACDTGTGDRIFSTLP